MTKMEYFESIGFEEVKKRSDEAKRAALHKGPCSCPMAKPEMDVCTCPRECILHGRCCDCIAHHMQERLDYVKNGVDVEHDYTWIPHCMQWFDAHHGIGMEKDPEAGMKLPGPRRERAEGVRR